MATTSIGEIYILVPPCDCVDSTGNNMPIHIINVDIDFDTWEEVAEHMIDFSFEMTCDTCGDYYDRDDPNTMQIKPMRHNYRNFDYDDDCHIILPTIAEIEKYTGCKIVRKKNCDPVTLWLINNHIVTKE